MACYLAISNLLVDTTTNLFCVVSGSNVQRCRVRVTVGIEHQDEQNGEGHADRHRCDDACRKRVSLVMCSAVVDNIRKLFVLPSTCDLLPKTIQDAHSLQCLQLCCPVDQCYSTGCITATTETKKLIGPQSSLPN